MAYVSKPTPLAAQQARQKPLASVRSSGRMPGDGSNTPFDHRYYALDIIATVYRMLAWLGAAGLTAAGVMLLTMNTSAQQTAFVVPAAIACFFYAGASWLTCMFIAHGIRLFVDIAGDVRSIAAKLNE